MGASFAMLSVSLPFHSQPSHPTTLPVQARAEALGTMLAAVACVAHTIELRLKELQPGRGRQAAAGRVEGAISAFALPPSMPEAQTQVCGSCLLTTERTDYGPYNS